MSRLGESVGEMTLPLAPESRTWGGWVLFGVTLAAAVATWGFLIGGYVAYYLPAVPGMLAMVAGSLVGILIVILAVLPVSARFGIETVVTTRPALGSRGSVLALALVYVSITGWNALLIVFLGRAAAEIMVATGLAEESARHPIVVAFSLIGLAFVYAATRGGSERLRRVGVVLGAMVIVLATAILVMLLSRVGWEAISSARPIAPAESKLENFTLSFETVGASVLAWWAYVGAIVRRSKGPKTALWPAVFGLGLPIAAVSVIGLWSALAFPASEGDPTAYLIELGGLPFGLTALAFIIVANVGTVFVGTYAITLSLREIPTVQKKLSWNLTALVVLLPLALVVAAIPDYLFEHLGAVMAFTGVMIAPMCGVQIADYYFVRRGNIDLRGLYLVGSNSPYFYWRGFNLAGYAGVVVGFAVYLWMLDPVTFETNEIFKFTSAIVPSTISAGAVYLLVTRWQPRLLRSSIKEPTPMKGAK